VVHQLNSSPNAKAGYPSLVKSVNNCLHISPMHNRGGNRIFFNIYFGGKTFANFYCLNQLAECSQQLTLLEDGIASSGTCIMMFGHQHFELIKISLIKN
jgi:hypothetical protein